MACRDKQRSKVYEWERQVVAPKDKSLVPFNHLQSLVDYIWKAEGLAYPPKVKPIPKQVTTDLARADRLSIDAPEKGLPTWVLLHELSHSLTCDIEGNNHHHGAVFMGAYINLLDKYCNIDRLLLIGSLSAHKIEFTTNTNHTLT